MNTSQQYKIPKSIWHSLWQNSSEIQKIYFFIGLSILFRIFFSLNVGLIDDEAYHWSWTKDLMLSYYDHPAMIAWINALSCNLFGDNVFAIRLPSFLFYLGSLFMLWILAKDLFNNKIAATCCLLMLWSPLWGFGGYVASPEPPFIFFWLLSAWIFWQGVRPDDKRWSTKKTWLLLGLTMGLGLNSKFIMALLAPGFGWYLLATKNRNQLLTRWPWVGIFLATIICIPIFYWNQKYGWPGFVYQFHDRHQGGDFDPNRWLGWLAAQILFLGPALYLLVLAAILNGLKQFKQENWKFILCLSLPSLFIFYPQPLWADYKPHWSGPAYLILMMGAVATYISGLNFGPFKLIKARSKILRFSLIGFLVFFNLVIYPSFAHPILPKLYRILNPHQEWKSTWDLSNEFFGWKELGQFVNEKQRLVHAESGHRPFLAALRYETTAQSIWGTGQKVYSLSKARSHYTVMQSFHHELETLIGQDSLVVTTEKYPGDPSNWAHFDDCKAEIFRTYRSDELSREFTVWYCRNFKGLK